MVKDLSLVLVEQLQTGRKGDIWIISFGNVKKRKRSKQKDKPKYLWKEV